MLRSNLSSSQKSLADKKVKVAGPSNQHCLSSYTTQPYEWIWTKNKNTVSDAPATFGKSRQFTIAFSNFWQFMTTFCNLSQLLAIIDLHLATLQFLAMFGNFCQLLPCHHATMSSCHPFIISSCHLVILSVWRLVNLHQSVSIIIKRHQSASININQHQPASISFDEQQLALTSINHYQSASISTSVNQQQSVPSAFIWCF